MTPGRLDPAVVADRASWIRNMLAGIGAIPAALAESGVIGAAEVPAFLKICGYRNRMVHFYHRVSDEELYRICKDRTSDIGGRLDQMLAWIEAHREED